MLVRNYAKKANNKMSIDPGMLGHTKETYTVYQADTITPIHDRVLVTDMEFGEQKTAGAPLDAKSL